MRDLFVTRDKTRATGDKLEFLMKQVIKLQNEILKINKRQDLFEQKIIEQEEKNDLKYQNIEKNDVEEIEYFEFEEEKPRIIAEIKEKNNNLELEAIKSVAKNKKTIIKQKILAIASKQRTTSKQVKEIIVDKYKYCSKATFYRYVGELKQQHKLETISVNNKEYVCNISINSNKR